MVTESDDGGSEGDEVAAADAVDAEVAQGITFTTVANLLIPGDGTEGVQQATTTTTAPPEEGSSADDENRLIWMIIAGLGGVAVLVALLTWRYWLLTRPGLDLDDGFGSAGGGDDRPYGEPQGGWHAAGAGAGTAWNAQRQRGRGAPDPYGDEPRDQRRTFVGPPSTDYPGATPASPAAPGRPGAPGSGRSADDPRGAVPRPGPGARPVASQDPGARARGARRSPGGVAGQNGGSAAGRGRGAGRSEPGQNPGGRGGRNGAGEGASRRVAAGDPNARDAGNRQGRRGDVPPGDQGRRGARRRDAQGPPVDPGRQRGDAGRGQRPPGPGEGRGQPPRSVRPDGGRTVRDTDIWARQRRR